MALHLGLDIGSTSINTVLLDEKRNIVENYYNFCHGKPFYVLKDILLNVIKDHGVSQIDTVAITGSGGNQAKKLIGGHFVNEIISQSSSTAVLYPQARTIIEMGGEDSKLIFMDEGKAAFKSQLSDFSMNSLCAAGTGSFLDQQANRIGVSIENEFGELALKSEDPPRIAGRCSVFAKSDMIHLQQIATPLHDIVAGLCFAVARNYKSTLGRGKQFEKPIVFQGGVSANSGMVQAFKKILNLKDNELIIPEYYASMGAIGALYHILDNPTEKNPFKGVEELEKYLVSDKTESSHLEQLKESKAVYQKDIFVSKEEVTDVFLGLDIGSLSTNVVLIDDQDRVIARRYLPTASKPLDAIRRGLKEISEEVGDRVNVRAAGTTGSGRYLTGDFIGADTIQNEITAQATAAIANDPTVDTIFEIGGQDSKFISIENGVVVDFEMNKVCAAGTGSFLEEQAEKLNINIVQQFGELALGSKKPARLGDRCTVFMDSDLNAHQQKGETTENLVGGLAYSIVLNYMQKVVGNKRVGDKIFFQGGVTNNKSVVAAFEKVTGKQIIVPPHFDVTGAIGAAMLARKEMSNGKKTRFKGFGVSEIPFTTDKFTCKECSNHCEIRRIKIEGEKKFLFYGGRCDKWEVEERKGKGKDIPNYYEERTKLLVGDFFEKPQNGKITIGIPRTLQLFYQQFPFWRTFFDELDFQVVVSDETDTPLVTKSLELMVSETCLPVEVVHGHIDNLLNKKVDHIFIPFIINSKADKDNPTSNCNCPWIQSYPFMMKSAFKDESIRSKFLVPTLHFRFFGRVLNNELSKFMKEKFGISRSKVIKALKKADAFQEKFESVVRKKGEEVLANIPEGKQAFVVIGRPYNTTDPFLNLNLIEKLINLDVIPIPIDFLPLKTENVFDDYRMMYWPNGQKIISASKIIAKNKNLFGVYLGNFRCGPDSFLTHFVREEMQNKPFLHLEVDEHSADAGLITRCEAFLDSLKGYLEVKSNEEVKKRERKQFSDDDDRTLYFPYMRDSAYAVAASCRNCGLKAEVLPMQDQLDIEIARKHTSGVECFPLICTTGSFLRKLQEPGCDPSKVSFFMPDHNGPCRFGQYNKLQRQIFDRLGFQDAQIISPSNDNAYAEVSKGQASKFRFGAWKGIVAVDMLRKLQQERRPYELVKGETNRIYKERLDAVVKSIETGAKDLVSVMEKSAEEFKAIKVSNGERKPLIAIVGEIFMRDNAFCSANMVERLEQLGAETLMAPLAEWLEYSTYRFWRDSVWKSDIKGLFGSKLQGFSQHTSAKKLINAVKGVAELDKEVHLDEVLTRCDPYVHKHYDGDPPLALGSSSALTDKSISGIAAVLPFTCMPGTLIASVSGDFRKDHDNIPFENIAYDGQEDSSIETRLQAFVHQAKQYSKRKGFDKPRKW